MSSLFLLSATEVQREKQQRMWSSLSLPASLNFEYAKLKARFHYKYSSDIITIRQYTISFHDISQKIRQNSLAHSMMCTICYKDKMQIIVNYTIAQVQCNILRGRRFGR